MITREDRDKILNLIGEERNSYVNNINNEVAELNGKVEGADYILGCLLNYFRNDKEDEEE